jgi:hypothetical protein
MNLSERKKAVNKREMMDLVRSLDCSFTLLSGPASLNGIRGSQRGPFPDYG